jgi:hypothetical protein
VARLLYPRMAAMNAMFGATFIADCSQFFEDRYANPNWRAPEMILIGETIPLSAIRTVSWDIGL